MNFKLVKKLLMITAILSAELFTGTLFSKSSNTPEEDPDVYVIDKSEQLSIWLYPLLKTNSIELKTPDMELFMKPHGTLSLGLGFNYKSVGLGFSLGLPTSNAGNQKFGESKKFDLQLRYYGKKLAINGIFQNYKGYYVANPNDLMSWTESYFPQNENMRVKSYGGSAFYYFNSKKFSYRAPYIRTDIQKKSAGSFTAGVFGFRDEATSDNGFIPDDFSDSIQNQLNVKDFYATTIGLAAGYTYTLVIGGNFFANLSIVPGVGYRSFKVTALDNSSSSYSTPGVQLQTKVALGYEFKWFYVGASAVSNFRFYNHDESQMHLRSGQIRLTIGKRFGGS